MIKAKTRASIRLSLHAAAQEFGLNDKTLSGRIKTSGVLAGDDGCYSIKDICRAVFGDIDNERLRLVREQADSVAIKNASARGELLPAGDVRRHFEAVLISLRSGILASNLEPEEKSELLLNLKRLGESVKTNEPNPNSTEAVVEDSDSSADPDGKPVGQ